MEELKHVKKNLKNIKNKTYI